MLAVGGVWQAHETKRVGIEGAGGTNSPPHFTILLLICTYNMDALSYEYLRHVKSTAKRNESYIKTNTPFS